MQPSWTQPSIAAGFKTTGLPHRGQSQEAAGIAVWQNSHAGTGSGSSAIPIRTLPAISEFGANGLKKLQQLFVGYGACATDPAKGRCTVTVFFAHASTSTL